VREEDQEGGIERERVGREREVRLTTRRVRKRWYM
jgi:hypothetical protein